MKQLVGQEFVVSTIENSISKGQIAHAYLFSGPRGTGKTSSARILAKSLNCQEGPTAEPCGVCPNCVEITKGNSLDVIEIDGASNTGVNDIREIKDEVLFAPTNSRYKVYIIDEVHMLSNSAFNALLKTIEEPPPYIIFIFATTEIHKVPATIRSRCQQFNFRLFSLDTVKEQLAMACNEMGIKYEEDGLLWIAKEGTGSMRDSYTLFDQVVSFSDGHITVEKIREKLGLVGLDRINELARLIGAGEIGPVMESADRIVAAGVSVEQFLVELAEYFRNILLLKSGVEKESLLGSSPESFDKEVVNAFTENQLIEASRMIFQLYKDVRYSLNQRFELELLLSRMVKLRSYFGAEELLGQIQSLREQLTNGPIPVGSGSGSAPSDEGEKKKSLNNSVGAITAPVGDAISPPSIPGSEKTEITPPPSDKSQSEEQYSPEAGDAASDFFNMFSDKKRASSVEQPVSQGNDAPNPSEAAPQAELSRPPEQGASHQPEQAVPSEPPSQFEPPQPEPPAFAVMEEEGYGDEEVSLPSSQPPSQGDWWENLLNLMKKDGNVVLMGSMSKGEPRLGEDQITLVFPSEFIAESIEREKSYIRQSIARVMGREYDLNIVIEKPKVVNQIKEVDEKVDLIVRIFGGTVIQDGTGGK